LELDDSLRDSDPEFVMRVLSRAYQAWRLIRQGQQLRKAIGTNTSLATCCDALWASPFRPLQKRSEALELFGLVNSLRPNAICEIGTAGGGTAFLFTRSAAANAMLISVDIAFDYSRRVAIRQFAENQQTLFCLQGDSHTTDTVRTVASLLHDRQLDVLFIDGDHTYEGVSTDFELYRPLVRKGGLIIFHDIVPDFRTKHGSDTLAFSGGVPQFWEELKLHYAHREIVEDANQDGYGIGILFWPGDLVVSGSENSELDLELVSDARI
jgi:predicted O-methyltransferase YrrM